MVKGIALALVSLTAVAAAQPPERIDTDEYVEEPDAPPAFNMFGFRLTGGALPIEGDRTTVFSVGLGVEHPVFNKTRMFGEYEWLWMTRLDERAEYSVVPRPERHGTGHRASFGLRRELIAKRMGRNVRMFIDAELGGCVALVNDNMSGAAFLPGGFGGMRLGYDIYTGSDSSPSRTFEVELLLRAVTIQHGTGGLFGIGMLWGN
jgi:hypothetical protein